ncbi:hypothetical protein QOZ80_5AG0387090 [Eleusine coracana subsp. coracana]|nr:hypothetical protein QOZ80_5AG0387090 [Eleusine coracana subsp. coracana]
MEPCPPRPTAYSRPRPTAPPPPRPTSSLVVADLHRKLDVLPPPQIGLHGSVHELLPVLPPRQEPPQYEPPFGTAAAWDVDDDFGPTSTPIIDWTPDYSSNDRKPSSQYFTNLMTQDHDADLELLMQPDPAPTSVGKGSSKRGRKTYWDRIARDFHQNINFKRTTNSLEHRCGIIIKECMKFQGYFEEV